MISDSEFAVFISRCSGILNGMVTSHCCLLVSK